jgi:hypothetical protein
MNRIWMAGAAALAAVTMSGGAGFASPVKTMTVGDLAVRLARTAGVRLPGAEPEKAAAAFLRAHGLILDADLDRPALEMDLVTAGRALGVAVTTRQPGSPVTLTQGAALAGAARGSLLASEAAGPDPASSGGGLNVSCQGRDSRADRRGIPASPADPNATAPPCSGEPTP